MPGTYSKTLSWRRGRPPNRTEPAILDIVTLPRFRALFLSPSLFISLSCLDLFFIYLAYASISSYSCMLHVVYFGSVSFSDFSFVMYKLEMLDKNARWIETRCYMLSIIYVFSIIIIIIIIINYYCYCNCNSKRSCSCCFCMLIYLFILYSLQLRRGTTHMHTYLSYLVSYNYI